MELLKRATEALETIFNTIEHGREHAFSLEEQMNRVASFTEQTYDFWCQHYPEKEERK